MLVGSSYYLSDVSCTLRISSPIELPIIILKNFGFIQVVVLFLRLLHLFLLNTSLFPSFSSFSMTCSFLKTFPPDWKQELLPSYPSQGKFFCISQRSCILNVSLSFRGNLCNFLCSIVKGKLSIIMSRYKGKKKDIKVNC